MSCEEGSLGLCERPRLVREGQAPDMGDAAARSLAYVVVVSVIIFLHYQEWNVLLLCLLFERVDLSWDVCGSKEVVCRGVYQGRMSRYMYNPALP